MKVYTQPMVRGRVDDLVFCVCGTMYYARRYVKPRITEHNIALGNKVRIAMRLYKELSAVAMARLQQHTDTLNKQEPYRNGKGITRSSAWLQLFFRFMERHPELSWETVSMQEIETFDHVEYNYQGNGGCYHSIVDIIANPNRHLDKAASSSVVANRNEQRRQKRSQTLPSSSDFAIP